jgi:cyclic beta-1,2-glucan synthetase
MQIASKVTLSEPLNPDTDIRLREFAHRLAETHTIEIFHPKKTDLLEYLQSWEQALVNANAIFKSMPSKDLPDLLGKSSRAGEWMLDNFYVVKQTLRQIEEDLPVSFLRELPKLDRTALQGHSRIFALAREWIGYSQSQIDLTQTTAFVQEYQQVTPLMIG